MSDDIQSRDVNVDGHVMWKLDWDGIDHCLHSMLFGQVRKYALDIEILFNPSEQRFSSVALVTINIFYFVHRGQRSTLFKIFHDHDRRWNPRRSNALNRVGCGNMARSRRSQCWKPVRQNSITDTQSQFDFHIVWPTTSASISRGFGI
jgi:hypothetical protein